MAVRHYTNEEIFGNRRKLKPEEPSESASAVASPEPSIGQSDRAGKVARAEARRVKKYGSDLPVGILKNMLGFKRNILPDGQLAPATSGLARAIRGGPSGLINAVGSNVGDFMRLGAVVPGGAASTQPTRISRTPVSDGGGAAGEESVTNQAPNERGIFVGGERWNHEDKTGAFMPDDRGDFEPSVGTITVTRNGVAMPNSGRVPLLSAVNNSIALDRMNSRGVDGNTIARFNPASAPASQPGFRHQTIADLGPSARNRVAALGRLGGPRFVRAPSKQERTVGLMRDIEKYKADAAVGLKRSEFEHERSLQELKNKGLKDAYVYEDPVTGQVTQGRMTGRVSQGQERIPHGQELRHKRLMGQIDRGEIPQFLDEKMTKRNPEYDKVIAELNAIEGGAAADSSSRESIPVLSPNEIMRKTADGQMAVFDAKTKQFIRYAR